MPAVQASHRRAIALLLLTALLWSTSGLFVKLLNWHPLSIFSARGIVASVVFLIWLRQVPLRITPVLALVPPFTWGPSSFSFCPPADHRHQCHFSAVHRTHLCPDLRVLVFTLASCCAFTASGSVIMPSSNSRNARRFLSASWTSVHRPAQSISTEKSVMTPYRSHPAADIGLKRGARPGIFRKAGVLKPKESAD